MAVVMEEVDIEDHVAVLDLSLPKARVWTKYWQFYKGYMILSNSRQNMLKSGCEK